MGLQARLRHAMGERVLEIPLSVADRPFVIGRGPDANLIVPSVSVAQRQCVLFVSDGQWVIQEWTPGGTRINGHAPDGPTPLCVGDVLTIGAEGTAATLEIDPGGAESGRAGSPALDGVRSPLLRPAPSHGERAQPAPALAARPRPVPPRTIAASFQQLGSAPPPPKQIRKAPAAAGDPDGEVVDWVPAVDSVEGITLGHSRKKSSLIPLLICMVLAAGIIGGTAWFVVEQLQHPQVVVIGALTPPGAGPKKPATASEGAETSSSDPTADAPGAGSPSADAPGAGPPSADAPGAGSPSADAPSAGPPSADAPDNGGSPAPSASDDPDAQSGDLDWTDVMVARDLPDPAPAIVRYEDYRRRNPGKHDKTLRQFEAEAFDRLWWRRIAQLCHRRVRLAVEIEAKKKAIAEESDASFKARLQLELASLQQDEKASSDALHNDMGFDAADPPDLDDEKAIAAARANRNKQKYAEWSKDIGTYVRNHAGATPWGDEDL